MWEKFELVVQRSWADDLDYEEDGLNSTSRMNDIAGGDYWQEILARYQTQTYLPPGKWRGTICWVFGIRFGVRRLRRSLGEL